MATEKENVFSFQPGRPSRSPRCWALAWAFANMCALSLSPLQDNLQPQSSTPPKLTSRPQNWEGMAGSIRTLWMDKAVPVMLSNQLSPSFETGGKEPGVGQRPGCRALQSLGPVITGGWGVWGKLWTGRGPQCPQRILKGILLPSPPKTQP